MTAATPYDPEATMAGFKARRQGPVDATPAGVPPPPHDGRSRRQPRDAVADHQLPEFGNRRGNRIAYTINLCPDIARRLEKHVKAHPGASYGSVAVDAIRAHWSELRDELGNAPDDPFFPQRRLNHGRLIPQTRHVRKVLYITPEEATAIDTVRQHIGNIEIGQLHRLALERHLCAPDNS